MKRSKSGSREMPRHKRPARLSTQVHLNLVDNISCGLVFVRREEAGEKGYLVNISIHKIKRYRYRCIRHQGN